MGDKKVTNGKQILRLLQGPWGAARDCGGTVEVLGEFRGPRGPRGTIVVVDCGEP
jgi:hypothetical protein